MRNFLLIFSLLFLVTVSEAAPRIELINLQQRTADEIINLIQPHLRKNESASGSGFQLILKAEPERLTEIRSIVSQLDTRLRQLRIYVRQGHQQQLDRSAAGIRGSIQVEEDNVSTSGYGRILSTDSRSRDGDTYQVTGLEGTPVFIAKGISFPVTTTSSQIVNGSLVLTPDTEYQTASSGFYAKARINNDDQVLIELAPQRETLLPHIYGAIAHESIVTQVRGPLNEWLLIGGTTQSINRQDEGIAHQYSTQGRRDQEVWLKVEVID